MDLPFPDPENEGGSTITAEDQLSQALEAVREKGAGKWQGAPFLAMVRSSVVRDDCTTCTGNMGAWEGWSQRRWFWAPIALFFGLVGHNSMKSGHPVSGNGHFSP